VCGYGTVAAADDRFNPYTLYVVAPVAATHDNLCVCVLAAAAADSHAARVSLARSAEFLLPPAVARLVAGGMELGQADDQVGA
jgi:non-canonical (house-cleaning) NTP pyrophosphatase